MRYNITDHDYYFTHTGELSVSKLQQLCNTTKVYSYLLRYSDKHNEFWLHIHTIDVPAYNTIDIADIYHNVTLHVCGTHSEHTIFGQPPVEILLTVLEPMIYKCANRLYVKWPGKFTLDDLLQECRLLIIELHRRGYYIHRSLVWQSLRNNIECKLRKGKKYKIESLNRVVTFNNTNDIAITLEETIPDEKQDIADDNDTRQLLYDDALKLLEEIIGKRQLDQLLREYGDKTTTNRARIQVNKLKKQFADEGITWSIIIEHKLGC